MVSSPNRSGNLSRLIAGSSVNAAGTKLMVGYYSRSHDTENFAFHRRSRLATIADGAELVWQDSFQVGADTPIVIGQDPVLDPEYMGDYDQIAADGKYFQTSWVGRLAPGDSATMKVVVKGTRAGTFSDNARGTTSSVDSDNSDDSAACPWSSAEVLA